MKKKDIMYLLLAVMILLVAGYLGYTKVLSHPSAASQGLEVPVVGTLPSELDDQELVGIRDTSTVLDFYQPIDLTTGLNNPAPFGH